MPANKTFVVLGAHRGGTSAVAKLLHYCDVWMGDNLAGNFENREIRNSQNKQRLVNSYNLKYKVWGFKDPSSINYINGLKFVNPEFIIVTRNIFDVARSQMNRADMSLEMGIDVTLKTYNKIFDFYFKNQGYHIFHFFSYEEMMIDKKYACDYIKKITNKNIDGFKSFLETAVIERICNICAYVKGMSS